MNKDRRIRIKEATRLLDKVNDLITDVLNEEDMAFNNLSEGLQQTMRGEQMEENIDALEEIKEKLEEIIDAIDNIE